MRFTLPVRSFAPAFAAALKAARPNGIKPILSHVKCRAEGDGTLTLQGTDLEHGVVSRVVGAEVLRPGEVILHGKKVAEILAANKDEPGLEIEGGADKVVVRCDGGVYRLPAFDGAEFPDVEANIDRTVVAAKVAAVDLGRLLERGAFAATRDEDSDAKFDWRAVILEVKGGVIQLASSDGKTAGYAHTPATIAEGDGTALVSARLLSLLAASLPAGGEQVGVRFEGPAGGTANAVAFTWAGGGVWGAAMAAKCIPITTLLQLGGGVPVARFRADDGRLLTACRRAGVACDVDSQRVELSLSADGSTAAASGAASGESAVKFTLDGYAGDAVVAGFNGRTLRAVERAVGGEAGLAGEAFRNKHGHVYLALKHAGGFVLVNAMK